MLVFLLASSLVTLAQQDAQACRDHPLFTRLNNFYIVSCSQNYNQLELRMSGSKTVMKEGNLFSIDYGFNSDAGQKYLSPFQVIKNYENAIIKNGGKMLYKNTNVQDAEIEATFQLSTKEKDYWVKLGNFGGTANEVEHFFLYVLEMEPMKQEILASEMMDALNRDGFISLYINFETGKADIEPDSQPIIEQIVEMLKQNTALKISIEGHTDNVGSAKSNQVLSESRAKSVMDAVVEKGIAKNRLSFKGFGDKKPISDNSTEEGRAKNRRVEIVKI